jgi:hypothetical protein
MLFVILSINKYCVMYNNVQNETEELAEHLIKRVPA